MPEVNSLNEKKQRAERKLPPLPDNPVAFSIPEAAAILRVSRSKVYDLIDGKHLHRIKIGRRAVITKESIDAFLTASAEIV